ncbi:hypothetical protein F4859DRAFT_481523 [Xylaria cf. heliscus]|nr:hypothetical protein F4859DRAFT_481523 [Xylaria cf. heliscus]
MGFTYQAQAQASASAAASAGVGNNPQQSQTPTTTPPLTTIFTPPPECKTPLAFDGECQNALECDGSYMPFLYLSGGTSIQCYPEVTTFSDGFVDAILDYNPGLFCPDGMTTASNAGSVFFCCPSGLTYDGQRDQCTATLTTGVALEGPWQDNSASIVSTTSFSAADRMTLYASARAVYLTARESSTKSDTFSNTLSQFTPPLLGDSSTTGTSISSQVSSNTHTSNSPTCQGNGCQTSTTPQSSTGWESNPVETHHSSYGSEPSSQNQRNLKIGIGVGVGVGAAAVLILLGLGYVLLRRYRRRRLLRPHQLLDFPPLKPGSGRLQQEVQQIYKKKTPSELPVPEPWVELEGTRVEEGGPGIYVWKPELEGTAGIRDAKGVYVLKKSELETIYNGVPNHSLKAEVVTYPESPIIGASFSGPRYPAPTARTVQRYT